MLECLSGLIYRHVPPCLYDIEGVWIQTHREKEEENGCEGGDDYWTNVPQTEESL